MTTSGNLIRKKSARIAVSIDDMDGGSLEESKVMPLQKVNRTSDPGTRSMRSVYNRQKSSRKSAINKPKRPRLSPEEEL